ncbi:winged helix-turn-helix transcriptional regulator [Sporomusa aerivorans]|uniref:winged helix-turn-helix transcriptional regulator n=1 Tax=Sporomusa aerivorans TaxID=204936 RepID=UPI00352A799A
MFLFNSKYYQCPFDCFISILKGKWRTTILLLLAKGPKRFAQLQKGIDGISAKVLSENLQILEESNILHREVYPTVPPTVEYNLTEKGMVLVGIMNNINDWSNLFLQKEKISAK